MDAFEASATAAFLWDVDLKGFGVKAMPSGAKSYMLQYRMGGRGTPTRRYTIGSHGSPWTPDSARRRAQELLSDVRRGIDPISADRTRNQIDVDLSFARYVDSFIERYAKREQQKSWHQAEQVLQRYAVPRFSSKALPTIERREIARLLEDVAQTKSATARYLHACLRKLFRWAVSRGDLAHSPMSEMGAPVPAISRDRVLGDDELAAIWNASRKLGFPFGPAFRLLIATGQRREEVGAMSWEEVDLKGHTWTIPAARSKNGVAHLVPLNALAVVELETLLTNRGSGVLVFTTNDKTPPSGWSKAKARLDGMVAAAAIPAWRTHDIRRTVATNLQRLGVRFEVTEAILNHVSGARSGVAGIYQRHSWSSEKRQALEGWGAMVDRLISGVGSEDGNIVLLDAAVRS